MAGSVASLCPTVVAGLLLARRLQGGGCHSVAAVQALFKVSNWKSLLMQKVHRSLDIVDGGKHLK